MAEAAQVIPNPHESALAEAHYREGFLLEQLGFAPLEFDGVDNAAFQARVKERVEERAEKSTERTELQDILMEPLTITLAGKEYEVHPHKIADETRWRKELGKIAGIVAGALAPLLAGGMRGEEVDLASIDLAALLEKSVPRVIEDGIPAATGLMLAYCAEMQGDWEIIQAGSTPMERMEAALDVVHFAFPQLLALLAKMLKLANVARR